METKPTKKEIMEKTTELQKIMIAYTEIDEKEMNVKLEKANLHNQLKLIRDEITSLTRSLN